MALARPRLTVPVDFEPLDDAQWVADGGTPMSAWLGRSLAHRDRFLVGHVRRGWAWAYPQEQTAQDLPIVADIRGVVFGPRPLVVTGPGPYGVGECVIRCSLRAGAYARIRPWSAPMGEQSYVGRGDEYEITGTGSATRYGPFEFSLDRGDRMVGVTIYPQAYPETLAAYETDDVTDVRNRSTIQTDAGGAAKWAAWVAAGTETLHTIRLISDTGRALTGWHRVIRCYQTTAASDTVDIAPMIPAGIRPPQVGGGTLACDWESALVDAVTVYGITLREQPLGGLDIEEVSRGR